MLKKFLRDPLLMFVVLGAVVFALYYSVEDASQEVVELSEINRKVFAEQFEMLTGREATAEDREKIESDYIQEEVLFREAIKAGMYLTDPEVRSKLIEEMRYQVTGAIPEPEETELVAYYLEHIDRYFVEATYSFRHVYFEQLPENADAILAQLQAGEEVAGDEFWRVSAAGDGVQSPTSAQQCGREQATGGEYTADRAAATAARAAAAAAASGTRRAWAAGNVGDGVAAQ